MPPVPGSPLALDPLVVMQMAVIRNNEWAFGECINVLCVLANFSGPCVLTAISKLTALLSDREARFHCAVYRTREHNNTMQKLLLNYMRLHEHTHLY